MYMATHALGISVIKHGKIVSSVELSIRTVLLKKLYHYSDNSLGYYLNPMLKYGINTVILEFGNVALCTK